MSDVIISVEGLGKRYRISHQGERPRYTALRDVIAEKAKRLFSRSQKSEVRSQTSDLTSGLYAPGAGSRPPTSAHGPTSDHSSLVTRHSSEDFWALKDVSFEVKRGEVVGIIGRNGAGKSTLLKILSRITEPTTGRVHLRGRVASLLEVGTGFHPELTGRENVFLNGAILGMTRAEIKKKFDEIVAFAEVEKFLDTPVKRYSSGMYVRLAFAVAAHLEPEILIVDEVLAVGDAEFQKKCLGKMSDVAKGGRTVLFVSHNMAAVNKLCLRAIMLNGGRVIRDGEISQVVNHYLNSGLEKSGELIWPQPEEAPGNERVRLKAVRIISEAKVTADVMLDQDCHIEIDYVNYATDLPLAVSIHLLDRMGVEVLASANFHSANLIRDAWFGKGFPKGVFRTVCTIPANFLNEGRYSIRVALVSNISTLELLTGEIIGFNTHDTGEMRKEYTGYWLGVVKPKLAWQTERLMDKN
ncbi:MAG TPA: ABC transporter ATP-binding protein [Verrucomicrobiae bacterium]